MAEKKNVDWEDAKKRYAESDVSMGDLARELGVSKGLVVRKLKGVQKISATLTNVKGDGFGAVSAGVSDSKLTQNARVPETRMLSAAAVSAGSSTAPAVAAESAGSAVAVRPIFANQSEELLWVESQVAARQDALVSRFEVELKALRQAVYAAARSAGTEKGFAAARTAKTLGEAFERQQKLDLQAEGLRTRREIGTLYGAGPRPCVVVVHQIAGASFGDENDDASILRREKIRHTVAATRAIMRQQLGDAPKVHHAIEEALAALEWDADGNLIDGVDDVEVKMIDAVPALPSEVLQ